MGTCKDCVWWVEDEGLCHAHPPTLVWDTGIDDQWTLFPETHEMDWCGEFKARETAEKGKDQ